VFNTIKGVETTKNWKLIPTTESYQDFLFAMNSLVTRERYSTRLGSFFVHIGIEGTPMEERCRRFVEKVKESEENGNI
jgi:hypothetical protein